MSRGSIVVAGSSCPSCGAPVFGKTVCCPCCCAKLWWFKSLAGWHVGGSTWWRLGPPVRDIQNPCSREDAESFVGRIWGSKAKIVIDEVEGIFECKRAGYVDDEGVFHEVSWSSSWAGLIDDLKPIDSHPRLS